MRLVGDGLHRRVAVEGEDRVALGKLHLDVVGPELVHRALVLAILAHRCGRRRLDLGVTVAVPTAGRVVQVVRHQPVGEHVLEGDIEGLQVSLDPLDPVSGLL